MASRDVRAASTAETEDDKLAAVRKSLDSLYGTEEKLIVVNEFDGIVVIGFGKRGDEGGHNLERSKIPVVLTDIFPREMWLNSPDFRQALAKGRIRVVPPKEYERMMAQAKSRQRTLDQLAALDRGKAPQKFDGVSTRDPEEQADMDIDETTASLVEVNQMQGPGGVPMSEIQRGMDSYDAATTAPSTLQPPIQAAGHSARAESLVERAIRGALSPTAALTELESERSLFSREDLEYIAQRAPYRGVQTHARSLMKEA